MARKPQIEYPGAVEHFMNRGGRPEWMLRENEARQRFIIPPGEACGKTGWKVHSLCLSAHHFHRVVERSRGNLIAGGSDAGLKGRGGEEVGAEDKRLRRGWCLGAEWLGKEWPGQMKEPMGAPG
jgi:hypothetical protein